MGSDRTGRQGNISCGSAVRNYHIERPDRNVLPRCPENGQDCGQDQLSRKAGSPTKLLVPSPRYVRTLAEHRRRLYMSTGKQYYGEPSARGGFSVRTEGPTRASAILPTRKEATKKAQALNPDKKPRVAPVRHTAKGHLNQFEKSR